MDEEIKVVAFPHPWPRFWVIDIHSAELKGSKITTGKLLRHEAKEDLVLHYLCMCGSVFSRVMGEDQAELELWAAEHRVHNHKQILDLIPEKLRKEVAEQHEEQ